MCETVKAVELKKMPFVVICGDLPVYSLLVELVSENNQKFSKILPWLSQFHLEMSMMNAIYKRYQGSELDEVLVVAGVIAEGSVEQALKGKHYRRGLRCLRAWYECLIYELLKDKASKLSGEVQQMLDILHGINTSEAKACSHNELMEHAELTELISNMFAAVPSSDMADYWKDFLSMCDALFLSIHANHVVNSFDDLINSQHAILPWLTIYDNNQYSRWLPYFWSVLSTLPEERQQFLERNYSHSLTGHPYSGMSLDMIIEVTMNKGSKLKSGWLSILKNEKQLLVHSRNCNNIGCIRTVVHDHINKKKGAHKHSESMPLRLKCDEQVIQDLSHCINEFECFPFDPAFPTLRTLQSAVPASRKLIEDLKSAYIDGEAKLLEFLDERVFSKLKSLFEPVPKNRRVTFAKEEKGTSKSPKDKIVAHVMESQGLASIIEIVEKSGLVDLNEIMKHRITEESLSIFNANGTFRVQKSKLLEKFNLQPIQLDEYVALIDMGMIWRMATPTVEDREKADGTVYTWGDYVSKIINLIISRHPDAIKLVLVNDPYNLPFSLKDDEHDRRSHGNNIIPRVFPKLDRFQSASEFKIILCGPENKCKLQNLVKIELSRIASMMLPELTYSCGTSVINLSTGVEVPEFKCNQYEADTIMFSIYSMIRSTDCNTNVVIDVGDTDFYVQAAALSHKLDGSLGIKRKAQMISCYDLCTPDTANIIIPCHTLTGCDSNNGFYGHGKKSLYDKVAKIPRFREMIIDVGKELPLPHSV